MAHPRKDKKKSSSSSPLYDNFRFEPLRQVQAEAQMDYENGKNLVLTGYAGTGKTFIAIAFALQALLRNEIRHIHIVRSAVSSRDIGFLPGTEAQKLEVYEKAIRVNFNKLLKRDDAYECLKHAGVVSFGSTSFERGLTYEGTCIIVDEFQNCGKNEINTLVTRLGKGCRVILCGDTKQCDLRNAEGFNFILNTAKKIPDWFACHNFEIEDIVRSGFVKAWIIATESDQLA
jgi:phosphate starvation-inducible PhoH-like protein